MYQLKKMISYHWQGVNRQGKLLRGRKDATSFVNSKNELQRQGIHLIKLQKKHKYALVKINSTHITAFTRQLATLLLAGIPLMQALELIARGETNFIMTELINTIKIAVEKGCTVAEALAKCPLYFNDLYQNLIAAGEQSGTLDVMFERVANYKEKTEKLINKVKKALFYPLAVLLIALIVAILLLVFVVPQFEMLFANFGASLPVPTKMVIKMGDILQHYGWLALIIVILLTQLFVKFQKKSKKFTAALDKFLLKIPAIGLIVKNATLARFARTLATLFSAGLPLTEALQATAAATGNQVYLVATLQVREEVMSGNKIHLALQQTNLFPNVMIQMIAIGEESGTLEKMLLKIAETHENLVDAAVDNLSSLLEPFVMVILGLFIGGMVIALYLPIFKLGSIV